VPYINVKFGRLIPVPRLTCLAWDARNNELVSSSSVLKAFSCRLPTPTTTIVAEGIDHGPGEDIFIADGNRGMANTVCKLPLDHDVYNDI
jgi:hypothetical protein